MPAEGKVQQDIGVQKVIKCEQMLINHEIAVLYRCLLEDMDL